jgi:hypothetical protein
METIGGKWFLQDEPQMPEAGPRPRNLVRESGAGRVVVDRWVQKYRFYEPDCVVYQTADAHHVFAVCGDRTPVDIASSAAQQWAFDPDGLTRAGEPDLVNGRVVESVELVPIGDILRLAEQQPPFQSDAKPAVASSTEPAIEPVRRERPIDANAVRPDGNTPLIHAVIRRRPDLVDALLSAGADPNGKSQSGATPLMIASGRGNLPLVDRLLSAKANVDLQDNAGATALMYAAGAGETEIVRRLRAHGADPALRDTEGLTARERVSGSRNNELLELLTPR